MTTFAIDILICRNAHDVWEELRHIDRHVGWMSDALRIDFHSDQREGVGTTFDCRTRVGPFTTTDVMTITLWKDDSAMGVTHRGLFTGRGDFTLSTVRDVTKLTWQEELRFPWWLGGALGAAFAQPVLRAIWRKNLTNLRRVIDQTVPRSS